MRAAGAGGGEGGGGVVIFFRIGVVLVLRVALMKGSVLDIEWRPRRQRERRQLAEPRQMRLRLSALPLLS
jgi:hypothetical protein